MSTEARRDIFQAIADPTRRQIINLIAGKPMTISAVAEQFSISQPAISQQIKILIECGVVQIHQQGRERFCEARLDSLKDVAEWIGQYHSYWGEKFDSLDRYLSKVQSARKSKKKHKK